MTVIANLRQVEQWLSNGQNPIAGVGYVRDAIARLIEVEAERDPSFGHEVLRDRARQAEKRARDAEVERDRLQDLLVRENARAIAAEYRLRSALANPVDAPSKAVRDVLGERQKQIDKGYTPEHDDQHTPSQILSYSGAHWAGVTRSQLVRLAACALAAIERCDRVVDELERGDS